MTITITLEDIKIHNWMVDVDQRRVDVSFSVMKDTGEVFETQDAVFWETVPDPLVEPTTGEEIPSPDNWYQLPAQYSQVLTDLTVDLRAGLLHLIGD